MLPAFFAQSFGFVWENAPAKTTDSGGAHTADTQTEASSAWVEAKDAGDSACRSRSTSAGRSSNITDEGGGSRRAMSSASQPQSSVPIVVKNTFVDQPVGRPVSLEGYFCEREVHSCPASREASMENDLPPGLEAFLEAAQEADGRRRNAVAPVPKAAAAATLEETPAQVRNTFIDLPLDRPSSLDGFFQERNIRSCPASRMMSLDEPEGMPGLECLLEGIESAASTPVGGDTTLQAASPLMPSELDEPVTHGPPPPPPPNPPIQNAAESFPAVLPNDAPPPPPMVPISTPPPDSWGCSTLAGAPPPTDAPSVFAPQPLDGWQFSPSCVPPVPQASPWLPPPPGPVMDTYAPMSSLPGPWPASMSNDSYSIPASSCAFTQGIVSAGPPGQLAMEPCVLQLSEALPDMEVGSAELPTLGSRGHHMGRCKPCAFVHNGGCESGILCQFCHLCEPGEKKRRAKQKKEVYKMLRRQKSMAETALPSAASSQGWW